jgi:dipeptidyl aminopeptidase/acylaminoacyl peptidase
MAVSLRHHSRGGFQFAGTLARAPLAGGTPREVLEGVFDADWAPDGSALAVLRSASGRDRLEFPIGRPLAETLGWISHPRFSPRGDRIAFLEHHQWPDDGGDVALVDLAGRKTSLSAGWYSVQGLAWSPDGGELWFTASENSKARSLHAVDLRGRARIVARVPGGLTIQDVAGDGRVLLTRDSVRSEIAGFFAGEARERALSWLDGSLVEHLSADGRTLLFSEIGEAGGAGYGAYVRATDGSAAVRLGAGMPLELSPDGSFALTLRRTPRQHLVLLPTGPGEPRSLPPHGLSDILAALWFPDGARVVVNGAEPGRGLRSYVQDLEDGALRPGTPEGVWAQLVSPDGTLLATTGGQRLALHPLDGGEARPVAGALPGDRAAQWSPDGRALYVFRRDEIPCRVYRRPAHARREGLRLQLCPHPHGPVRGRGPGVSFPGS